MKSLFSKEKWQQLFYTVSHPSDGFYWIRHGEKGSVAIAILMVVLFGLCFTLNRLLAGFVVNDINERTVNALWEMSGVLMLYLLLCVGNWSITCLMDGEGRLKDIAIAIGYSLLPMIVCYIAATIVSQFVAENEEAFYAIIIFLGTAYTLIMALIGIMQVHNYTLGKTLLTLLLTLVAVFIIIFSDDADCELHRSGVRLCQEHLHRTDFPSLSGGWKDERANENQAQPRRGRQKASQGTLDCAGGAAGDCGGSGCVVSDSLRV